MKFFVLAFAILTLVPSMASAQDYRIYTRVSRPKPEGGSEVLARTLTLWHAGKAYDWSDEVGELAIYDPAHRRYTLVSGRHRKACTVDFGELRNYLKVAHSKAQEYLQELSESDSEGAKELITSTRFQLNPQFEIQSEQSTIRFTSQPMTYQIETIQAPNADIAKTFAEYADWASQLNYLLHGQALMPGPRMAVNKTLSEQSLLPVQVTLDLHGTPPTRLIAEHTIQWNLSSQDRDRIRDWQAQLEDGQLKFLSFQDYQSSLLSQ